MTSEQSRLLKERDAELSHLKPMVEQFNSKIKEHEAKDKISNNTIQQLEQKIKAKEWVIKNLKEENMAQRSRESTMLAQMEKLNESIDAYETKFHGKDVDVPMLLIKLKEYVDRTQDLECQVRRLTNRKLNELVLLSRTRLREVDKGAEKPQEPLPSICDFHQCEGAVNEVSISIVTSSNVECDGNNDGEVDTLYSDGTDEMMMMYVQEESVLGELLDTLEMESACCLLGPSQPAAADDSLHM
jgi:hypothetical protein